MKPPDERMKRFLRELEKHGGAATLKQLSHLGTSWHDIDARMTALRSGLATSEGRVWRITEKGRDVFK